MIPGLGGGSVLNAAEDSVLIESGLRDTRADEGKVLFVGVAGRTLTEVCGLRATLTITEPVGDARDADADDVDDALDRLC
jgi:hypothetical protein